MDDSPLPAQEPLPHNSPIESHDLSSHPSPEPDILPEGLHHTPYTSSEFYESDQPPSSTFPSEPCSAFPSEPSSIFPSEPSSAVASGPSSAMVSYSEPPPPSSIKATKQTGLLNFFSTIPPEQHYASWRKRKRDNKERDQEEYARRKRKDEAEQNLKKARRREQNRNAQTKRRENLRGETGTKTKCSIQHNSVSSPKVQ